MTFHLKGAVSADLPATARVITDPGERRALADVDRRRTPGSSRTSDAMTAYSPMIEVTILDKAA